MMPIASGQSTISKVFVTSCYACLAFLATLDGNAINGIVPLLEQNFNINDSQTATIKTASSIVHTVTLAVLWISGDYFQRRKLFISSTALWIALSLLSILLGSESYAIFVAFRALASGAHSIASVLEPVMIADLFQDRALGLALMIMTGCDMISGNFIGILNSWIVTSGVPWQSGLIAGPLLSVIPLIGLLCSSSSIKTVERTEGRSIQKSLKGALGLFSIKSVVLLTTMTSLEMFHVVAFRFFFPSMVLAAMDAYPETFLGQSYTVVTTLFTAIKLSGMLIGMPTFLWFAQCWRHGSGPFFDRGENLRAFPIVMSAGALLYSAAFAASFLLLAESYSLFLVSMFLVGLGAATDISLSVQSMIMVVPSNSRAGAMAMSKLISGLFVTPAAQIIGFISDTFRGDSTLAADRFHAYQLALLCSTMISCGSALCDILLIFTFKQDVERAAHKTKEEEEESIDESTFLIGSPKNGSESLIDAVVRSRTTTAEIVIASCILTIKFLSSIDKYDIDGVVPLIKENFHINDAQTGIIRTSSSIADIIVMASVWILGDFFNRRRLFLVTVSLWITLSIMSIVLGSNTFVLFVGFRTLGAAASAVFYLLTPVLLADMFEDRALGTALMIMTGCELISGLVIGIASSWILTAGLPWQSGLIFGPVLSIVPLLGLVCAGRSSRNIDQGQGGQGGLSRSLSSAFGVFSIKSFLCLTAALSLGNFAIMAYTFWLPSMFLNAWNSTPEAFPGLSYTAITILNSAFIMAGYLAGLPPVLWFAQSWRHGTGPFSGRTGFTRAYPIVGCAGAFIWAISYILYVMMVVESYVATLACIFFVGLGQAAQSSLGHLMLLTVVPASSRASAVALKSLITAIASAPSAQIVGVISDAFRGESTLPIDSFHAYQKALLFASLFLIATAISFSFLVVFFPGDCERAVKKEKAESDEEEEVDEWTSLIGKEKSRSSSILDNNH